jgi:hypothetical protein
MSAPRHPGPATHTPVMKDSLFQAHLDRTMGYATYGGADVRECRTTAARIHGSDIHGWRCEWIAASGRARTAALEAEATGDTATARDAPPVRQLLPHRRRVHAGPSGGPPRWSDGSGRSSSGHWCG